MNRYFIGFFFTIGLFFYNNISLQAQTPACLDLKISFTQLPINCARDTQGTITAVPEGGKAPYTYLWASGAVTSSLFTKIGTTKVTITDANGCKVAGTGTLTAPPPLQINLTTENESYRTAANGTAIVNPSGGTPPYKALWSSASGFSANDTNFISKLAVGTYKVALYDAKWCSLSQNFDIGTNTLLPCQTNSGITFSTTTENNALKITATHASGIKKIEYIVDANNNGTFEDDMPRPYTTPISADSWGLIAGTYNVQVRITAVNGNMACQTEVFDIILPVLSSKIYATVGKDIEVYFENLILAKDMSKFKITIETPVSGVVDAKKWKFFPQAKDVGTHPFVVKIKSKTNQLLYTLTSKLCIAPADAGKGQAVSSVLLGHSYVSGYFWTHDLYTQYFKGAENPVMTSCGSVSNDYGTEGVVRHDGIAATTWNSFINPTLLGNEFNPPNPYWHNGKLDMTTYSKLHCSGKNPDYMMVMLDLNDVYWVQFKKIADIDVVIDVALKNAEKFIQPIIAQQPNIQFGIILIPPMADFMDNVMMYNTNTGFQTRQIGHRLIQRWIEKWDKLPNKNISLLSSYMDFDRANEYDAVKFRTINDFHPSPTGYNNLAKSCFSWVKYKLYESKITAAQELPQKVILKVYPNPVTDRVVVEAAFQKSEKLTISLLDVAGKRIFSQKHSTDTAMNLSIDLSNLQQGIYFLQISSESGWQKTEKIVKMF